MYCQMYMQYACHKIFQNMLILQIEKEKSRYNTGNMKKY